MSSNKESALSKIQNLYLMQVELLNFLDAKEADTEEFQSAQKTLREFKALLKEADWRYMGGEDVLESLQWIPQEVNQKLSTATPRKAAPLKNTTKKPSAKKKASKKKSSKK